MKKFTKATAGVALGIGLLGLAGCATGTGYLENNVSYEKFHDSRGEWKLVNKNNDLYAEKIDGSENRQITHTPLIKEDIAFFTEDGKYIVYSVTNGNSLDHPNSRSYLVRVNEDDSKQTSISSDEQWELWSKAHR